MSEVKTPDMFEWTSQIDLYKFFKDTYPFYQIFYCKFQHVDCRRYWKKVFTSGNQLQVFLGENQVYTINGICAEFNPGELILDHQAKINNSNGIDMQLETA